MKNVKLWLVISLVVILLVGCTLFNPTGDIPQGSILFQDDFSNPKSGWDTWSETSGSQVMYSGGGLRILVREPQFDYWSVPGKRFSDVRVEVDAIKLDGPNDNDFGLICRYQNRDNFYALLISSDGYAGILKVKDGAYSLIHGAQMEVSQVIHQGSASNRLRAVCQGTTLALFINGQPSVKAVDLDFAAGEAGVLAGTNNTPGVDILFDNFVVVRP